MNCRLCDKDITGKNGLLLYDYNENVETKLGRKINIILNSTEKYEHLSNYCCDFCSCKIDICFSLLVEIQASDEVIRQTYENWSHDKKIDTASQLFICGECKATVSGIKSFIKHYENHILKKTTIGSKKDVTVSGIVSHNRQEDKRKKSKESIFSEKTTTDLDCGFQNKNLENVESIKNNENSSEKMKQGIQGDDEEDDDYNDDSALTGFDDYEDDKYSDDEEVDDEDVDGDDDGFVSSVKVSSDEEFEDFYDDKVLEKWDSSIQNSDNGPKSSTIDNNLEELREKSSQDFDDSDVQSEDSLMDESNYQQLLGIVQRELEKPDAEDDFLDVAPSAEGTYDCECCKLSFEYKFILQLHIKSDHKAFQDLDISNTRNLTKVVEDEIDAFIKCCYCKTPVLAFELKDHVLECREASFLRKNVLCQICGKMYGFRDLEKHMEEHKKLDGWTCELCGKKFKAKRFLKSHLGEHDESKKKICEICGKKLLPLSFFSHIMKHREKRHVCQYCGKAFTYNYGLRIHLRVHDNKKLEPKPEKKRDKVFCWLCKKDFDCTIALNKHLKNDHNAEGVEQDSRFPCSQCDKKFADMFSLKAHLKLIHEMKDEDIARLKSLPVYRYIECNVCNKVFNSENKIRIHMKQDHGLKPFEMEILKKECEKCGKKFASKQNLIHHINGAHLHIKPMTCDICQEKFAKHSSLIYHKLRHSGEKPFQCEYCQKSYRQRNDVIRHLARHVRDKELTLEEASAVNNSPSRLVLKRRIFLKDSSINYQTIVRKNRRKSEVIEMEPILEEEINEIQEEQMEFNEDGIPGEMIYVEGIQVDENQPESPSDVPYINAKPVYNEERNTIILSSPDVLKNSVKNVTYRYIPSHLKHMPAVIVKKQEQI